MTKSELVSSMRTFVKGGEFISQPEISKFLRVSRNRMPELLDGVQPLGQGKKRYFIPDVAERVLQRRI